MYDLIYCNDGNEYNSTMELLKKEFPQAKIEGASDEIHNYRFSIELPELEKENYIQFMIEQNRAYMSLLLQS